MSSSCEIPGTSTTPSQEFASPVERKGRWASADLCEIGQKMKKTRNAPQSKKTPETMHSGVSGLAKVPIFWT
jgi:hypothetical protein